MFSSRPLRRGILSERWPARGPVDPRRGPLRCPVARRRRPALRGDDRPLGGLAARARPGPRGLAGFRRQPARRAFRPGFRGEPRRQPLPSPAPSRQTGRLECRGAKDRCREPGAMAAEEPRPQPWRRSSDGDLRQHRRRDRRPDPRPALDAQLRVGGLPGRQDAGRHLRGQPARRCPAPRAIPRRWSGGRPSPRRGHACRSDLRDPAEAMPAYVAWLKALPGKPVFVAYPAGFDFLFVYWYLIRFAGESPFSFSALDIKTFAMAAARHRVPRRDQAEHAAALVRRRCRTRTWRWTTPSSRGRCSATCWRKARATDRATRLGWRLSLLLALPRPGQNPQVPALVKRHVIPAQNLGDF